MTALVATVLAGLSVGALEYRVPVDCPTAAAFWTGARRYAPHRVQRLDEREVRVTVTATAAGYAGVVWVAPDHEQRMVARSCTALIPALGRAAVRSLLREEREAPSPVPVADGGVEISFGAAAAATWGAVPGAAFVVPLFAELRWPGGPVARASFRRTNGEADDVVLTSAVFSWLVVRVDLCPVELDLEVLSAVACASVEGGVVQVETAGVLVDDVRDKPWLAAGVLGRVRFPVMDGQVFVEASGGVSVPFVRHRYVYGADLEVHVTAPVVGELAGGAGLVF